MIREQGRLLLCIGRRVGDLSIETLRGKERQDEFELVGLRYQCDGLCSILDSIAVSLGPGVVVKVVGNDLQGV